MSNPLSNDLIAQFAKAAVGSDETKQDATLRGTITRVATNEGDEGVLCVKIDGSDIETPVSRFPSAIADFVEGDRVEVTVKNHSLTITGNTSSRAISTVTADNLRSTISQTADEIKMMVEDTSEKLQSSITINADQITSLSSRMGEAESSITQNADSITSVVKRVGDTELNITTLDGNLGSLVDRVSDNETTVDDLTARVTNAESSITQNADSISSVVKGQVTMENTVTGMQETQDVFSEFKQTVEGFSFMGTGGTVKIQGGDINLTGAITWSDLDSTAQGKVNTAQSTANNAASTASNAQTTANNASSLASSAYTLADAAYDNADDAITTVSGFTITEGTKTYIDGQMIYSDSIYADSIHLGGELTVYKSMYSSIVGGYMGYCTGWNNSQAIGIKHSETAGQCLCGNTAARLSYGTPSGAYSQFVAGSDGYAYIEGTYCINLVIADKTIASILTDRIRPAHDSAISLGASGYKWSNIYATTSTISTSDRNQKNSIEDLPEKYIIMFDQLRPVRFKLNDGTSDRYHMGYIAQEVEEAMIAAGVDSQEFGGLVKDKDEEGNDMYMLRYGEFDAIRDAKIKQLEAKNLELEARIEALEKLLTQ